MACARTLYNAKTIEVLCFWLHIYSCDITLCWVAFLHICDITNNCPFNIWPGTLSNAGIPQLAVTGFQLGSGQSGRVVSTPGWSGRIWARTGCKFDPSGIGRCETGDCGGWLQCGGLAGTPPQTLFEIAFGEGDNVHFYDVSLVDGYNLPLVAVPRGVFGECNATGCASDINLGMQ